MEVELVTDAGELVARERIPPFVRPPKAIVWGARFFLLDDPPADPRQRRVYREAFVHVIPPAPTGPGPQAAA